MPSVTKLAITAARNVEGKLSARPKGTGTSEIPVTLYEIENIFLALIETTMKQQKIKWYELTKELSVKENGEISYNEALELLTKYIKNQNNLDGTGEDAVAKSMFGFSVSDKTFIEINIDTKDKYRIKFEHPQQKKIWIIPFTTLYQVEYRIENLDDLKMVIKSFFDKTTDDFLIYFDNLPYKRERLHR